jgi:DNA-binding transcriptional ArsR family regulator
MYQKEEYSKNNGRILLALIGRKMDFTSLKDEVNLSSPTLAIHLRDLVEKKFVECKRDGRRKIYGPGEKAFDQEHVKNHLIGLMEAYRTMKKSKNFWSEVGKKSVSLMRSNPDAAFAFISAISRFTTNPVQPNNYDGSEIVEWIYLRMVEDFNQLRNLIHAIQDLEMRDLKAEKLRKKFENQLSRLKSIYISLGPPFSYRWMEMVEELEL